MQRYEFITAIGDGSFGTVSKARDKQTNELVAIKKIKSKTFASWEECLVLPEVSISSKLFPVSSGGTEGGAPARGKSSHSVHAAKNGSSEVDAVGSRTIVRLREVIRERNELYFVFEYLECDLLEVIRRAKELQLQEWKRSQGAVPARADGGGGESERSSRGPTASHHSAVSASAACTSVIPLFHIKCIFYQLIQALHFLHGKGFFHRDLKPENLLVSPLLRGAVADPASGGNPLGGGEAPAIATESAGGGSTATRVSPDGWVQHSSREAELTAMEDFFRRFFAERDILSSADPRASSPLRERSTDQGAPSSSVKTAEPTASAPPKGSSRCGSVEGETDPSPSASSFYSLRVKLGDFGLVKELRARPPYTDYVSTRWYRSPELLLQSKHYSAKVDIWAAGCLLFELLTLNPLFAGKNEIDQLFIILQVAGRPREEEWPEGFALAKKMNYTFPLPPHGEAHAKVTSGAPRKSALPSCPYTSAEHVKGNLKRLLQEKYSIHGVPGSAIDIMEKMLRYDARRRWSAEELLGHPFFAEVVASGLFTPARAPAKSTVAVGDANGSLTAPTTRVAETDSTRGGGPTRSRSPSGAPAKAVETEAAGAARVEGGGKPSVPSASPVASPASIQTRLRQLKMQREQLLGRVGAGAPAEGPQPAEKPEPKVDHMSAASRLLESLLSGGDGAATTGGKPAHPGSTLPSVGGESEKAPAGSSVGQASRWASEMATPAPQPNLWAAATPTYPKATAMTASPTAATSAAQLIQQLARGRIRSLESSELSGDDGLFGRPGAKAPGAGGKGGVGTHLPVLPSFSLNGATAPTTSLYSLHRASYTSLTSVRGATLPVAKPTGTSTVAAGSGADGRRPSLLFGGPRGGAYHPVPSKLAPPSLPVESGGIPEVIRTSAHPHDLPPVAPPGAGESSAAPNPLTSVYSHIFGPHPAPSEPRGNVHTTTAATTTTTPITTQPGATTGGATHATRTGLAYPKGVASTTQAGGTDTALASGTKTSISGLHGQSCSQGHYPSRPSLAGVSRVASMNHGVHLLQTVAPTTSPSPTRGFNYTYAPVPRKSNLPGLTKS